VIQQFRFNDTIHEATGHHLELNPSSEEIKIAALPLELALPQTTTQKSQRCLLAIGSESSLRIEVLCHLCPLLINRIDNSDDNTVPWISIQQRSGIEATVTKTDKGEEFHIEHDAFVPPKQLQVIQDFVPASIVITDAQQEDYNGPAGLNNAMIRIRRQLSGDEVPNKLVAQKEEARSGRLRFDVATSTVFFDGKAYNLGRRRKAFRFLELLYNREAFDEASAVHKEELGFDNPSSHFRPGERANGRVWEPGRQIHELYKKAVSAVGDGRFYINMF